jgi:hypothetical protein
VRLDTVTELVFEAVIARVIDVEIHEGDPVTVFLLEPVHDGRQLLARRSPEREELDQRRPASSQVDRCRICRLLAAARRGRRRHRSFRIRSGGRP